MKFIWFDWGSTLAYSKTRKLFMCNPWVADDILYPNVRDMLAFLKRKGVHIGLVSNMKYHAHEMDRALLDSGLLEYFDFTIYNTSRDVPCKKPCPDIFQRAYEKSLQFVPDLQPSEIVMVGNSVPKDLMGFLRVFPEGRVIHAKGPGIAKDVLRFFYMNNIYDVTRSHYSVSPYFDGSSFYSKTFEPTSRS